MRKAFLPAIMTAAVLGLASPASAGILINSDGIFWTGPDPSLQPSVSAEGITRFGGPATGFRRFGRDGYYATPRDPGQPFHGRTAFGAAGRQLDDALRAKRLPGEKTTLFSLSYWGL